MRVREVILEGGNVQIGAQSAQRLDLKKLKRDQLIPVLDQLLQAINAGFAKMHKRPLWSPRLVASRKFLSGSAFHFFNVAGIPSDQFVKYKPTVGDIDTQVDQNLLEPAKQFLDAATGKQFGPATLIGYKSSVEQLITLWAFSDPPVNVQIDLEFVEYEGDEPTEWAQFSHSSAWNDIEAGIKGVFHKYLLRALSTPSLRDVVVLSGKKETPKVVKTTDLAFAVTRGLRYKLSPVMDGNVQREMDGLKVYKEIPTKESTYETNLYVIAKIFFGNQFEAGDIEKFWSYLGTLELVKKYFDKSQQSAVVTGFVYTLFGPGAQELYRGDPEQDAQDKNAALEIMTKTLGVPYDKKSVDAMRKDYYSPKA
jgi:hypothetical protein